MGDFGVFVRGTTLSSLDGALVIETSDEAESRRFLAAVERLGDDASGQTRKQRQNHRDEQRQGFTATIDGVPKPIEAFVQSGKVVFAYGDAAAKDAVGSARGWATRPTSRR